ncbi:hypothetical protein GCM10029992_14260 [Glycomyces albus]
MEPIVLADLTRCYSEREFDAIERVLDKHPEGAKITVVGLDEQREPLEELLDRAEFEVAPSGYDRTVVTFVAGMVSEWHEEDPEARFTVYSFNSRVQNMEFELGQFTDIVEARSFPKAKVTGPGAVALTASWPQEQGFPSLDEAVGTLRSVLEQANAHNQPVLKQQIRIMLQNKDPASTRRAARPLRRRTSSRSCSMPPPSGATCACRARSRASRSGCSSPPAAATPLRPHRRCRLPASSRIPRPVRPDTSASLAKASDCTRTSVSCSS